MAAGTEPLRAGIRWTDAAIDLGIDVDEDGTARLTRLAAARGSDPGPVPGAN